MYSSHADGLVIEQISYCIVLEYDNLTANNIWIIIYLFVLFCVWHLQDAHEWMKKTLCSFMLNIL